ncbi:MAG: cyclin domain-containing protein [Patescibacteria group bacterium]|nr:cyclin domain-containing protein [Patescibacteria group bacterium]
MSSKTTRVEEMHSIIDDLNKFAKKLDLGEEIRLEAMRVAGEYWMKDDPKKPRMKPASLVAGSIYLACTKKKNADESIKKVAETTRVTPTTIRRACKSITMIVG